MTWILGLGMTKRNGPNGSTRFKAERLRYVIYQQVWRKLGLIRKSPATASDNGPGVRPTVKEST